MSSISVISDIDLDAVTGGTGYHRKDDYDYKPKKVKDDDDHHHHHHHHHEAKKHDCHPHVKQA